MGLEQPYQTSNKRDKIAKKWLQATWKGAKIAKDFQANSNLVTSPKMIIELNLWLYNKMRKFQNEFPPLDFHIAGHVIALEVWRPPRSWRCMRHLSFLLDRKRVDLQNPSVSRLGWRASTAALGPQAAAVCVKSSTTSMLIQRIPWIPRSVWKMFPLFPVCFRCFSWMIPE